MIDWLRRDPREAPVVDLGDARLPVTVRRHPTARRMTMRLSPDGREVRITIPRWGQTAEAIAFAHARKDWLAAQLEAVPVAIPVRNGTFIGYRGGRISIHHDPKAPRRPVLLHEAIRLGGPAAAMPGRIRRWLEEQARSLLTDDLAEYCAMIERSPPRLTLSGAKQRWGSCAANGSIRINWRLIMAPDFVRRSVVAHEVAHLVHFDHSQQFHALLARLFEGDIGEANAWLKREGRTLYQPFG